MVLAATSRPSPFSLMSRVDPIRGSVCSTPVASIVVAISNTLNSSLMRWRGAARRSWLNSHIALLQLTIEDCEVPAWRFVP
jgi:hypothetical protein